MDLKAAAKKPQLHKIVLDSDHVLETYGEPLEFYMYDRYSITEYMRLSSVDQNNYGAILDIVYELVCDANGNRMLEPDDQLEPAVMVDMMNAVVAHLGNLERQTSTA